MKAISIEFVYDDRDDNEARKAASEFLNHDFINGPMAGAIRYDVSIPKWAQSESIQSIFDLEDKPGFTCGMCNRSMPYDEDCGHGICLDCSDNDHCTNCRGFIRARGG